ncbi:DUF1496 domain-containing protein [Motiliproteus sp. SC1-56]|uniref:DUF1496 domain-containing protein n=1 Tax=Motiliproteus sp. SC1-56 TaxID=2799565 RepID=UPI001A90283C|nr:DUF1496 domain-containing protein [Motiliproteus sp. SC1-56]
MSQFGSVPHVGAQDPELQNSPITDEVDEEYEVIRQEVAEAPACYFNDVAYPAGSYVRDGTSLLICDKGVWVNLGSGDPDNP